MTPAPHDPASLPPLPPPPGGATRHGEIEVILPDAAPAHLGPVGLIARDQFLAVCRDAVRFPSGATGAYWRLYSGDGQSGGAVVLPLRFRRSGEVELAWASQWRHAVGAWSVEIPRGLIDVTDPDREAGALRELGEETGLGAPSLLLALGDVMQDGSIIGSVVGVYVAVYDASNDPTLLSSLGGEVTEALGATHWAPIHEERALAHALAPAGRPVAPADLFTFGAWGLLTATGTLDRLRAVHQRMTLGRWDDVRLAPEVRDLLDFQRAPTLTVRCVWTDAAVATRALAMLPLLPRRPSPPAAPTEALAVVLPAASPLLLAWLLEQQVAAITLHAPEGDDE